MSAYNNIYDNNHMKIEVCYKQSKYFIRRDINGSKLFGIILSIEINLRLLMRTIKTEDKR